MLVELLQPAGPDLVRRLAAALMLVPRSEREAVVHAIERRVVETYGDRGPHAPSHAAPASEALSTHPTPTLTHVGPPVQRPGYIERIETEYERPPHIPASARSTRADTPRTRAK